MRTRTIVAGRPGGLVPWDQIAARLAVSGYDGPLSFHSHDAVPLAQALEQTRLDLAATA